MPCCRQNIVMNKSWVRTIAWTYELTQWPQNLGYTLKATWSCHDAFKTWYVYKERWHFSPNKDLGVNFTFWGAGLAQWWERSPSTNVYRVGFPDLASYVDWICWFSTLPREVLLWELRFSPLLRSQHLIWFDLMYYFDLFDLMIWFDLFRLQSPQLVEHLCSAI